MYFLIILSNKLCWRTYIMFSLYMSILWDKITTDDQKNLICLIKICLHCFIIHLSFIYILKRKYIFYFFWHLKHTCLLLYNALLKSNSHLDHEEDTPKKSVLYRFCNKHPCCLWAVFQECSKGPASNSGGLGSNTNLYK